jgi:hypothetical protein
MNGVESANPMKRIFGILILLFCQFYLTAQTTPPPATSNPASWSWFGEAGASTGNNLLGGLGIAMDAAAGQQIFGEIALETGSGVAQSSQLLIGVKSNYPSITKKGRMFTPFSIVAYGASIQGIAKAKLIPPASIGLNATTVTSIGTGAEFAQQYAAGVQTQIGSWNVGVGFSGDKTSGWKGYPFAFVSREFGSSVPKKP